MGDNQTFVKFDIVDFYPSISKELLEEAIDYAKTIVKISAEEENIIMKSKLTLLYSEGKAWCKKGTRAFFDITMGSFDGAESCELVGQLILHKLRGLMIEIGLYRDDGLGVTKLKPRLLEREKKKLIAIMKEMGLKVIIETSSKVIDYLDIELDLIRGVVKPYHKPNNITKYVHKDSNHPPHVIKNLLISVQKRISSISSNKEIFEQNITRYQEAIDEAGYNVKLEYNENDMKKIEKEAKKQNNADHNSEKK